jgi:DNA-directed RNA polymerase I, II, and III subunit RPABC2
MITRFEYARILGARALQLSLGAPVLVKLPRDVNRRNTLEVSKYELEKGAVPIVIVRVFPDGEKQVVEPKLN